MRYFHLKVQEISWFHCKFIHDITFSFQSLITGSNHRIEVSSFTQSLIRWCYTLCMYSNSFKTHDRTSVVVTNSWSVFFLFFPTVQTKTSARNPTKWLHQRAAVSKLQVYVVYRNVYINRKSHNIKCNSTVRCPYN